MTDPTRMTLMSKDNRWRLARWGTAALLMALPVIAMRFTTEVAWGPGDFLSFGGLLFGACGAYEWAALRKGSPAYRAATGIALGGAFLLVWMNLAVGLIGSEGNPANLMFGAVLGVGLLGAAAARFRPRGMSNALIATALAQAAAGAVAHLAGWGRAWVLTGIYVALWLMSAYLFHRAAREADRATSPA